MTAASLDHLCGLERRVLNDRQVRRVDAAISRYDERSAEVRHLLDILGLGRFTEGPQKLEKARLIGSTTLLDHCRCRGLLLPSKSLRPLFPASTGAGIRGNAKKH